MRVVDLDRDMSDVIPTGTAPDSEFLFARMTDRTLDLAGFRPGARVLDVASGGGQDAMTLSARGLRVVAAEPSKRMSDMARIVAEDRRVSLPNWVRAWSDVLPFADGCFDAVICKGAIDHFDRPAEAIEEMARVTARDGRVVLAIANFESLSCRLARVRDDMSELLLGRPPARGRRVYDVPSDHFTRYELDLMRDQASRYLELERVEGISLGWGLPGWARLLTRLPRSRVDAALQGLDWVAGRAPEFADVAILSGRPRRAASTSA